MLLPRRGPLRGDSEPTLSILSFSCEGAQRPRPAPEAQRMGQSAYNPPLFDPNLARAGLVELGNIGARDWDLSVRLFICSEIVEGDIPGCTGTEPPLP